MDFFSNLFNGLSDFFSKFFVKIIENLISLSSKLFGIFSTYFSAWMVEQGFTLEVPDNVFNVLDEITYTIGYIFPLYALLPIVYFMLVFYGVKIVLAAFSFIGKLITGGIIK